MKKIIVLFLCFFTSVSFGFAAKAKPEKLTVMLNGVPNPDHAPLLIAKQQGFFKEEGLDVNLIGPSDPTDSPKWVAAGKADIGITYEPEFMKQVDQGMPLIRIGTLIDKPLDCIVALKESGIKDLRDLKGKRIGSGSGGISRMMLKVALSNAGLSEKDVQLIDVRNGLTQALLSHKVDAIAGVTRNVEVSQLEQTNHPVVTFFPEESGAPNYSVLIFIVNKNNIHDKRLPHFLNAIKKAVAWLDEHPQETWKQFAKRYPEANNAINREAWFNTMPYFAEDPSDFDPKEWNQFAAFMLKNKMIGKIQPMSQYSVILD